jgi:uncharacterized protein (TIGR03435 family)
MSVPARRAVLLAICSLTTALYGQRLEFEAASVKLSPAGVESRVVSRYELGFSGNRKKLLQAVPRTAPSNAPRQPGLDTDGFPKLGPPSAEPEILTIQGRTRMFFPDITMKELADELMFKLRRPVVDKTGLAGRYDVGLYWSEDDSGPDLKQALRDQLGLRLTEQKGPLDVLIVQHIDKAPKDN